MSGEFPRGEKIIYSGTDPESYITEYTLVYEEYSLDGVALDFLICSTFWPWLSYILALTVLYTRHSGLDCLILCPRPLVSYEFAFAFCI